MLLKFDKETLRYNIKTTEGKKDHKQRNHSKEEIHKSHSSEVDSSINGDSGGIRGQVGNSEK